MADSAADAAVDFADVVVDVVDSEAAAAAVLATAAVIAAMAGTASVARAITVTVIEMVCTMGVAARCRTVHRCARTTTALPSACGTMHGPR